MTKLRIKSLLPEKDNQAASVDLPLGITLTGFFANKHNAPAFSFEVESEDKKVITYRPMCFPFYEIGEPEKKGRAIACPSGSILLGAWPGEGQVAPSVWVLLAPGGVEVTHRVILLTHNDDIPPGYVRHHSTLSAPGAGTYLLYQSGFE